MYKDLIFFIAHFLRLLFKIGNEVWLLALNFLLDIYTSDRIFNITVVWYYGVRAVGSYIILRAYFVLGRVFMGARSARSYAYICVCACGCGFGLYMLWILCLFCVVLWGASGRIQY